jgi:hypothetical protein
MRQFLDPPYLQVVSVGVIAEASDIDLAVRIPGPVLSHSV